MARTSTISWTDATWGPLVGCSKVSPGCAHCYAVKEVRRLAGNPHPKIRADFADLVEHRRNGQLDWTGRVRLLADRLRQPLQWKQPKRIFVNSMSDLFHESVPDAWLDQIFAVMIEAVHTFQILTKRPERMAQYVTRWLAPALTVQMLENIWLGTSIETRATLARLDALRQTPAIIRFVSLEPLLEDLGILDLTGIQWVIVGGESGANFRPCDPAWIANVVAQCQQAGVACWVKQASAFRSGQQGTLPDDIWAVKQMPTALQDPARPQRQLTLV